MFRVRSRLRVDVHRSKLEEHKRTLPIADAPLAKKERALRSDRDPHDDENDKRQPDRKSEQNAYNIEHAFPTRDLGKRAGILVRGRQLVVPMIVQTRSVAADAAIGRVC